MGNGPAEIAHGYIFTGFTINVVLYGIMLTQTYFYYTTYKRDRSWMKIFVVVLLLANTLNTIFDFIYLYRALIIHFADVAFLAKSDWYVATDAAITGIVATLVQLFFAWRVRVFTQNWLFAALVTLGALAGGGGAIATAVKSKVYPEFINFIKFKNCVIVWLTGAAVTDVLISVVLVWYLRKHKTGFQSSNLIVDRIIRSTIQTGLITSIVAILDLVFYLKEPTGIHLLFNYPLCKLYTICLMSSLNARHGWKLDSTSAHSGSDIRSAQMFHSNPPIDPIGSSNEGYKLKDIRPSISVKLGPSHSTKGNDVSMENQNSTDVKVYPGPPGVMVHIESHQTSDIMYQKNSSMAESQRDNSDDSEKACYIE